MPDFEFDPKRYPTAPGCYLMHGVGGKVIYVGKAKNLQRRLSSYFQARPKARRLRRLVAEIQDVEVILVNNETEALVLENNLIKHHRPRYNRLLTDDDTGYYYLALTAEDLPRFVPYRKNRINKDLEREPAAGIARLFGPYVSRRFRDSLLDFVAESFQIRTCAPLPEKVCLRYHLGWCGGICEQKVSAAEYGKAVARAVDLLSHRQADVIERMQREMLDCAERLAFERAQRIKTQLEALESTSVPQFVERDVHHDQDVIYVGDQQALIATIRQGMFLGLSLVDLDSEGETAERSERLLLSRYAMACPDELIVNSLGDPASIAAALTTANGHEVRVTLPCPGENDQLLKLCEINFAYRVRDSSPRLGMTDVAARPNQQTTDQNT